ncbi:hypothetical protein XENTR_v10023519 [Xenopus tropicalis]|nr:hypothetical protein XENTR_v10023519 [Xenopus tropicalis]
MNDYETGEIYTQLANILKLDEAVEFEEDKNTFQKTVARVVAAEMNCRDLIVPLYVYSTECEVEKQRFMEIKKFIHMAKKMTGK